MRNRAALLIGAGCILLSASGAFAFSNWQESATAERAAGALASAFLEGALAETPEAARQNAHAGAAGAAAAAAAPIGGGGGAVSAEEAPAPKPVVIDGYEYIGLLSIPKLNVSAPVNGEISYPLLKKTPCVYYGAEDGAMIIAAHNYPSHFGKLDKLGVGDKVSLTGPGGATQTYEVTETLTLPANGASEMLKPGGWDLTLFTCTYTGADRVTVRCVKTMGA